MSTEVEAGRELVSKLVGGQILAFGAGEDGEILLLVEKDGVITEVVVAKDEAGEICLFEIEKNNNDNEDT